jgi:hypothetical protein
VKLFIRSGPSQKSLTTPGRQTNKHPLSPSSAPRPSSVSPATPYLTTRRRTCPHTRSKHPCGRTSFIMEIDMAHPAMMKLIRPPPLASTSKAAQRSESPESSSRFHNVCRPQPLLPPVGTPVVVAADQQQRTTTTLFGSYLPCFSPVFGLQPPTLILLPPALLLALQTNPRTLTRFMLEASGAGGTSNANLALIINAISVSAKVIGESFHYSSQTACFFQLF